MYLLTLGCLYRMASYTTVKQRVGYLHGTRSVEITLPVGVPLVVYVMCCVHLCLFPLVKLLLTAPNSSGGKVIFSQGSINHSVHRV